MAKFLAGCLDASDNDPGDERESNSVSWNGTNFDALGDRNFEEVLWELSELNFRFELAALDLRMSGSTPVDHYHLVVKCFPDAVETGSLLVVKLECADQGLGSLNWQQRSRYLLALKRLMIEWTACTLPEIIKKKLYGKLRNSSHSTTIIIWSFPLKFEAATGFFIDYHIYHVAAMFLIISPSSYVRT